LSDAEQFFKRPILNSPYACPARHWELDDQGQPTHSIIESRRSAKFISPIPKPRKQKGKAKQAAIVFDEGMGLSTEDQQYDPTPVINELRKQVDQWRKWPNAADWQVTPETARLLQHCRSHPFNRIRPFFCQIEAVETAIWLTEVAPNAGKAGKRFLGHLANANNGARMNADLHMADDVKNTGKGNLFVIFGEPDITILEAKT
jgi:type III restriction enzyme